MSNTNNKQQYVKDTVNSLLKLCAIDASIEVAAKEIDNKEEFLVEINGEDLGILIGYHGETLSSIQHFLNLAFNKQFGEWVPISVDVGGYRKEQEQRLTEIAGKIADRAKFENRPVHMRPMPAYERKVVHTALGEIEGVSSSSEGEGRDRHIVVSPK